MKFVFLNADVCISECTPYDNHPLTQQKHTLLTEHQDAVSALAVANGKLVSGSWDTSIKVGYTLQRGERGNAFQIVLHS